MNRYQDLAQFRLPDGFRGRPAWKVQLWWLVQATLFAGSPQFAYGFRRALLRAFGARIGPAVLIRPSVEITYPWKLVIEEHAWVGDDVVLYSLGDIHIGRHAVVSQRSYLCAADHDHRLVSFPIRARPVRIEPEAWVGTDVYVGPGVCIGSGAVVGARSSVFRDLPPGMLCLGHPCRPIRPRDASAVSANRSNP